jgi:hypothetical protein
MSHRESLEFFRPDHGHEEVEEQKQGDEADDDGFHGGGRLEGFAAVGVRTADDEKGQKGGEADEVVHGV